MSKRDEEVTVANTVAAEDIQVRDVERRSFLKNFGAMAGAAGVLSTAGCEFVSDISDSDTGDPVQSDTDPSDPVRSDEDTGDPADSD